MTDRTPPKAQGSSAASRSIVLARHGEPALSRDIKLSAAGYRDWWARYELGGLKLDQTPPDGLLAIARQADVIFASVRPRAVETAEAVVAGKHFVRDPMFVEAPLPPPPLPGFIKFGPRTWGVIARIAWWLGHNEGGETRSEAEQRAHAVALRLIAATETEGDVLVLAHGYFNHMVGVALKRLGWKLVENRGFKYWAMRRYLRP